MSLSIPGKRHTIIEERTTQGVAPTTAGAGEAITAARPALVAALELDAVGGNCTLTGPVVLYGYRGGEVGKWYKLATLNDGDDIALVNSGAGYSEPLQHILGFDRLEVSDGGLSGNGYKVSVQELSIEE